MSNVGFDIEILRGNGPGNDPGFHGYLTRLGYIDRNARDFTPALERIRRSFYAAERRQFATLGGGHWAPNAPATLRRKAARGQDLRPMRASGALYRAITGGGGPGSVDELTRDELTVGVRLKKAGVAQRGSGRRRRRLIALSRRTRSNWTKVIREHVMQRAQP